MKQSALKYEAALPIKPAAALDLDATGAEKIAQKRVVSIDVIRGCLMILIVAGHGMILLDDSPVSRLFKEIVIRAVNLGTPAFTLVSGMLLGYFEVTRRDFDAVKKQYFRRGIQLITVAHLLIAIALFPSRREIPFLEGYLTYWYITDTLALLFVSVPFFISGLKPALRVAAGSFLLIFWRPFLFLSVESKFGLLLKEFLFGVDPAGPHLLRNTYPLIPLLGLLLIGTVIGNRLAALRMEGRISDFVRSLHKGIAPLLGLSFLSVGVWGAAKLHLFGGKSEEFLKTLLYPDKLYSLLPFYIAFFFILVIFYVGRLEIGDREGPADRFFLLFGRTSLFTYVVHYFMIQTFPYLLGWHGALNIWQTILFLAIAIGLLSRVSAFYQMHFLSKKSQTGVPSPAGLPH